MKKLIAVLLLAAAAAQAETLNPDRFPSVGLNMTRLSLSGDASATVMGSSASEDLTGSATTILADMRYPVSDNWTLTAALGGHFAHQDGTGSVSTSEASGHGLVTGLGVRYYFTGK